VNLAKLNTPDTKITEKDFYDEDIYLSLTCWENQYSMFMKVGKVSVFSATKCGSDINLQNKIKVFKHGTDKEIVENINNFLRENIGFDLTNYHEALKYRRSD